MLKLGNRVELVDLDKEKVAAINNKISIIYEEGLQEILNQVEIKATCTYDGLVDSDFIFLCVGTPSKHDGSISRKYLAGVTKHVAESLRKRNNYCVIVIKSTIIPGTTEEFILPILEKSGKKAGKDFGLYNSPEFLREGQAIYYFMVPIELSLESMIKSRGIGLKSFTGISKSLL